MLEKEVFALEREVRSIQTITVHGIFVEKKLAHRAGHGDQGAGGHAGGAAEEPDGGDYK